MDSLIPIGSIIKTKNGKLFVVTGFFPEEDFIGPDGRILYNYSSDYEVISFPCSMRIDFDLKKFKDVRKALKKYNWYDDNCSTISKKEIAEVVFEGYKDEAFYELERMLAKN